MPKDHESSRDGFVVRNVPDGTPPEVIKQLADQGRAQGLKEIEFPRPERTTGDMALGGARQFAQGTTLGWADEGEAALRARMGDQSYEQERERVRQETAQFKEDYPKTSMGLEIAGAVTPALLTRGRTGVPSLTRVGAYGAGAGGIAGAGYSDNANPVEVAIDAGVGAATGGVLGAGTYAGIKAGGKVIGGAFDWIRSKLGARGVSVAENEIIRMAEATGMTPDEVVAAVARGEIMADNATLRNTLRSYYAKGDEKLRNQIDTVLANRAESKRLEGVAALQQGLAPKAIDGNMTRLFKAADDEFEADLYKAYDSVIGKNAPDVPQLQGVMLESVNRLPGAMDAINKRYQSAGNLVPPFKVNPNGAIEWTRIPTLKDAEILRRTIQKEARKYSIAGDGDIAGNLRAQEKALREGIDASSGALKDTRAQWSRLERNREAFNEGKKIFSKQSEDMEILVGDMMNDPASMQYMRLGFMSALNNKMTIGGRKSVAEKLTDPETKEGKAFRAIFPEDEQEAVLTRLATSAKAQETFGKVIGGSPTAITDRGASQIGKNISGEEVAMASTMNPIALARIAFKLLPKFGDMSQSDQMKVVKLLMEENPAEIQKALTNNESMRVLGEKLMRKVAVGTGVTATTQSDLLSN